MHLSKNAEIKSGKVIIITGSARSGTTIVAKIVNSLKNVELDFEPPTILSLFSCLGKIKPVLWKFLFSTYIYENFFLKSVAARNLNLNPQDDSFTFAVKSKQDIQRKIKFLRNKENIEKKARKYKCAFKLPDIVPQISIFQKFFPNSKIIICSRSETEVINSLLRKKWFNNQCLKNQKIWPFRKKNNFCIPFWVPKNLESRWINGNELERCNLYQSLMDLKKFRKNKMIINYDDLIKRPIYISKKISIFCGAPCTEMTRKLLKTVKRRFYL
jgi:hypothetical protein